MAFKFTKNLEDFRSPLRPEKIPSTDFFPNDTAKGFTQFQGQGKYEKSDFVGIAGSNYKPPLQSQTTNSTGFGNPPTTLNQQKTRGSVPTKSSSVTEIDKVYRKYNENINLQDKSFNISYIPQPYILRGIQVKGKVTGDKYGGITSLIDDGFIRGGAGVFADTLKEDFLRVSSWIVSPKGLLWTVRQKALGLTNPLVETSLFSTNGSLAQTRIHPGAINLLAALGASIGLRIPKQGDLGFSYLGNYENVIKANQLIGKNRLLTLSSQLGVTSGTSLIFDKMPIPALSGLGGPNSAYGLGFTTISRATTTSNGVDFLERIKINPYSTSNTYIQTVNNPAGTLIKGTSPKGFDTANDISTGQKIAAKSPTRPVTGIQNYATVAYNKIPKRYSKFHDFRTLIDDSNLESKNFIGVKDDSYYRDYNLQKRYGFGDHGAVGVDRSQPNKFLVQGTSFNGSESSKFLLTNNPKFRGDKITAIDIHDSDKGPYPKDLTDFIWFYFEDGKQGKNTMPFRCTITGLSDSFQPMWDRIDIMGRPDGAYIYTSFTRSVRFSFVVAATTRDEMIVMWRKLNYLASYTMPDFTAQENRPGGPFMRLTVGHMFRRTPGFIDSLDYSVPEEATWDIAEDYDTNKEAKKLPMLVEVQVGFQIIGDYRPQLKGRVYSLSPNGERAATAQGQWLPDSSHAEI